MLNEIEKTALTKIYLQLQDIVKSEKIDEISVKGFGEDVLSIVELTNQVTNLLNKNTHYKKQVSSDNLKISKIVNDNTMADFFKPMGAKSYPLNEEEDDFFSQRDRSKLNVTGGFSTVFNEMAEHVERRERKTKHELAVHTKNNKVLTNILNNMCDMVIILSSDASRILFMNQKSEQVLGKNPTQSMSFLLSKLMNACTVIAQNETWEFLDEDENIYYSIYSTGVTWIDGEYAWMHIITDITKFEQTAQKLEEQAHKDPLTSLYNRRYGMLQLENFIGETIFFSLAFVDLDGLKKVNDQYGHKEGDRYIKIISELFLDNTREEDVVCRIGGDEFIVIFPNCDELMAAKTIQRINHKIKQFNQSELLAYPISISCGISSVTDFCNISVEDFLAQVDEKMYIEKKAKQLHRTS